MSANGWTDDFVPQVTARNKSRKPILLILNGHGSHETTLIIELAEQHNIILPGTEMRRGDFIKEYMGVRAETFQPSVIISAFKKSGIWPVNHDVFTTDD
jgi:hypothetical protein